MTSPRPVSLLGRVSGLGGLPGPPTSLEAVITSTRFITLAWQPPETAATITGYSVYYQQQGSER